MSEQEIKTPQPKEVIREKVSPIEVGKYYLKAEFGRIFPDDQIRGSLDKGIEQMEEPVFWRLLEAISDTFRINGVFRSVGDEGGVWSEEIWDIGDLTLTEMNPAIDKVTHLEQVKQDPYTFRDYLKRYFLDHPNDDPEGLGQFRIDKRSIRYETVLLRAEEDKALILDGSHRLIRMLLEDKEKVKAFVLRRRKNEGKIRLGDSTFVFLRTLYTSADEEEKRVLLKVTKRLMENSLDGRDSVQSYWVDHIQDEKLKLIGLELLK